jgi:hypothetical protein
MMGRYQAWVSRLRSDHCEPTRLHEQQLQSEIEALTAQMLQRDVDPASIQAEILELDRKLEKTAVDREKREADFGGEHARLATECRGRLSQLVEQCRALLERFALQSHLQILRDGQDFLDRDGSAEPLTKIGRQTLDKLLLAANPIQDECQQELQHWIDDAHAQFEGEHATLAQIASLQADNQRIAAEIEDLVRYLGDAHGVDPKVVESVRAHKHESALRIVCERKLADASLEREWRLPKDVFGNLKVE